MFWIAIEEVEGRESVRVEEVVVEEVVVWCCSFASYSLWFVASNMVFIVHKARILLRCLDIVGDLIYRLKLK